MWKARFIVIFWKLGVIISFIVFINWLLLITKYWLLILLIYASAGLVVRIGFGRMIPTQPDGSPIRPNRSKQDYVAVAVIEFCNQYAFPLLWPIILVLVTLNPFKAD
jgi:hypothetical protein